MKKIIASFFVILAFNSLAQFSISAGPSLLKGFGVERPFTGFNLGLEIPQDDATAYYGRISHFFSRSSGDSIFIAGTAYDINTNPQNITLMGISRTNFTTIEGGIRYYLGDGFDYGWAGYGGTKLSLMFSKVQTRIDDYNESLYLIDSYSSDGNIFGVGGGLNGGVKYTNYPMGTIFMDAGLSILLFGGASPNTTSTADFSQFLFDFNIGYRRDIGW